MHKKPPKNEQNNRKNGKNKALNKQFSSLNIINCLSNTKTAAAAEHNSGFYIKNFE